MKIEKKLHVLDWMKIHYLDRECLNKTEEKELDNFVNELKEAINYTHCCKSDSEQLCECDEPLIRTSDKGGEYCGSCGKDLD
jgi:hypothetical protein